MPNFNGAGKYDPECQKVFDETSARGVVLLVIDGDRGAGFSVTGELDVIHALPEMLEQMAREIRAQRSDA
ncbi:hypothetical protein [Paraburkholderia sp. EG304]|uniref:hypothetical protein n=1 Tax=Paraburkholderia sp. EG304 TaxID=3237015 RepID=UPI00397C034A